MLPSNIAGTDCAVWLTPILDQTDDHVIARRNALIGIWAGQRLGFKGRVLAGYVIEVMKADHEEAGHRDILRRLTRDFAARGLSLGESEILDWLGQAHRAAHRDFLFTD